VEVLHALWDWLRPGFSRGYGILMAMGLWSCVSISLLTSAPFQYLLLHFSGEIAAFGALSRDSDVCGIGLYEIDVYKTPGYTYLPQGIELYELHSANELSAEENRFNAIIAQNSAEMPERSFSRWSCFDNGYEISFNQLGATRAFRRVGPAEPVCIWRRRGSCAR
jgi:hypothetical protein